MKDCFVDGVWTPAQTGATREVIDPSDASVVRTVADGGVEDARAAIGAARRAFDGGPWPATPPIERGRVIGRIADLLAANRDELARLETRDTGKTLIESGWDIDDVVSGVPLLRRVGGQIGR